jgi:hypothetical protein
MLLDLRASEQIAWATYRKVGMTKRLWEIGDVVDVLESWEASDKS